MHSDQNWKFMEKLGMYKNKKRYSTTILYASALQAFLDFRGFDFRDFQFKTVYNSILFSSL